MIEETGGYKRKREAEEATKKATEALQKAVPSTTVTTPRPPIQQSQPVVITPQPVEQIENQPTPSEGQGIEPKKVRKEKPVKVLDGWVYKETSQRGGNRWYLGEPEKEYLEKKEQKERERVEKQAAKLLENGDPTPPLSPSPTEHNPIASNDVVTVIEDQNTNRGNDPQSNSQTDTANLQVGKDIKL